MIEAGSPPLGTGVNPEHAGPDWPAAVTGVETTQATTATTSTGFAFGKAAAAGLAGLALLGGLWFFAARHHQGASPSADSAPSAATTLSKMALGAPWPSTSTLSELVASGNTVVDNSTADREGARPVASHHSKDRLAEEVALLSRAETALHIGKPAVALEILNEHERKFSQGRLAEERIAARIQALCALGRTTEADTQLALLSPKSLHGEQSRQACGARKSK